MVKALIKKEREQIFRLFLDNDKLKFNEIEKFLGIRSNMVSYHLEKMLQECLLEKKGDYYVLTKNAEKYIPVFSNITGESMSPLAVVLVAVVNKDKILLIKRNNRPYKDYWGLIGGKILFGENFERASERLTSIRSKLDCSFVSVNSVLHEHVKNGDEIIHDFMLFFTKVRSKGLNFVDGKYGKLKWFNIKDISKVKIIPSDKWLIVNKLNSKVKIKEGFMKESNGRLSRFNFS
ncbi:NUDIX domain-containing protein [Candidatus Woesearchaeota archaeon]|nr:NUDIX domain-containing protein [Candidatus Woesearchaeota archaeon]